MNLYNILHCSLLEVFCCEVEILCITVFGTLVFIILSVHQRTCFMRKRYMHISAPLNMSFLLHFFNLKIVCNEKKTVSFYWGTMLLRILFLPKKYQKFKPGPNRRSFASSSISLSIVSGLLFNRATQDCAARVLKKENKENKR